MGVIENIFGGFTGLLKFVGGIAGVVVIYWIVASILNARRLRILKSIDNNLKDIKVILKKSKK